MSKIQIITIATGCYKNFVPSFIESVQHFMPNDEKRITIYSDGLLEYQYYTNKYIKLINIKPLYDLIYPCININKPLFINEAIQNNADYIYWIDIDTIFKKVPYYDWNKMKNDLDSNKVLVTKHPFYILNDNEVYWGRNKEESVNNLYTKNLTEKDPLRSSYIPAEKYTYINSAFWAANKTTIKRFNDKIIELTRQDLKRYPYGYRVPNYMDENYVNKIVYLYTTGKSKEFDFEINSYTALCNMKSNEPDTVFMYQKNKEELKQTRQ